METRALLRGVRLSAQKGRLVADQIRGKKVDHALDVLTFSPRVADVADKKGGAMTLVVIETAVTNQHGAHVADLSRTLVVRNGMAA